MRFILGLLLLAVPSLAMAQARHAVLISLDGVRPDALTNERTPRIARLLREGSRAQVAETITLSVTLPSHTSMVTGLDSSRHHVTHNDFRLGFTRVPSLFTLLKQKGLNTAFYFSKEKFTYLMAPGVVDYAYGPIPGSEVGTAESACPRIAERFAQNWPLRAARFSYVHLREADDAGHAQGWMSSSYLEAVQQLDACVGRIVESIEQSPLASQTAVLVTADHGGSERNHNTGRAEDVRIPWILWGAGVRKSTVVERLVKTYDTAATIMELLGFEAPPHWDGRPLREALQKPIKRAVR